jgi:hypothetical protein
MINQLPDLEEEDKRYNLHVGADAPTTYNITLVYPNWSPPKTLPKLQDPSVVKLNLAKLGIKF